MVVTSALRLVDERNINRNWSPVFRAVGLRLQFAGVSVVVVVLLVTAWSGKVAVSLPNLSLSLLAEPDVGLA